jgi:putative transposase
MVGRTRRREAADALISQGLSQRCTSQLLRLSRQTLRREVSRAKDDALRAEMISLATRFPKLGYRMLHGLIAGSGQKVNPKRVYRIYREEGLMVRRRRRKKLIRGRVPMVLPTRPNERWSMDFVSDQLVNGPRFRTLNVLDDYSKRCMGQEIDFSLSGHRVVRFLEQLTMVYGKPKAIVTDNGPEFTCLATQLWARQNEIVLLYIQPGKPTQNAYVESFNGKFRNECLDESLFMNIEEAREVIENWRNFYNTVRPHSSLGYMPPEQFETNFKPQILSSQMAP